MIRWVRLLVFIASVHAAASSARAEIFTFNVISALSTLALSGEGSFGVTTVPYLAQGAGSLSATYSGTVVVDITATTIRLLPGTVLRAGTSGSWRSKVGGSTVEDATGAPANYGYSMNVFAPGTPIFVAVRGLEFGLSDSAPRVRTGTQFNTSGIEGEVTAGFADINYGNPPQSDLTFSSPFATVAAATGSVTLAGGIETFTLPLAFTVENFGAVTTESNYLGTIVATRVVPVPEPATAASLLAGLACFASCHCFRRRTARR